MRRWGPVAAYAALAAATQLLWLSFAPITTAAAHHYRVSETAIGWLAESFPLLYVLLALPAGRLLDRHFGRALAGGALLTALGGALRVAGPGFGWALAGQLLVAVAQPLVLNAVTKVSSANLPAHLRPHGIAIGSAGIFGGMLLALVLGTLLGGAQIPLLLEIEGAFAVLAASAMCVALRAGAREPEPAAQEAVGLRALREVWSDQGVRVLGALLFLGFGVFISITTWLQALVAHYGTSSDTAGAILAAMVLAGAVTAGTLPPLVARRGAQVRLIGLSIGASIAGALVLAAIHHVAAEVIVLIPMGALLLCDLPVILEASERRAGGAAGTVTALMWLAGNAGGIVLSLLVGLLVGHPELAFALLGVLSCAALPLLARVEPAPLALRSG